MKIKHFNKLIKLAGLTLAAIVSGLVSCNRIENLPEQPSSEEIFGENLPEENLLHQMNICVEDSLLEDLENATGEDGLVDLSGFPQYKALGVVKMRRLFPDAGETGTYIFGRIAVLKEYRRNHLGAVIISALEDLLKAKGGKKAILCSQEGAVEFYQRCGFSFKDDKIVFDEGHPHRWMEKYFEKN